MSSVNDFTGGVTTSLDVQASYRGGPFDARKRALHFKVPFFGPPSFQRPGLAHYEGQLGRDTVVDGGAGAGVLGV